MLRRLSRPPSRPVPHCNCSAASDAARARPPWSPTRQTWQTVGRSLTSMSSAPQVVFSGIQPTGVPHLGNYLGAIRQWVRMQDDAPPSTTLLFSVVDLHSLTSHQPPSQRRQSRREVLASFLAAGLDPERSIIFYQSSVPAHSEMHWILSCDASMGNLSRMTQWKSKLSEEDVASLLSPTPNPKSRERMKLGLFSYPVLQAADVLVHRTTHVPVGEDQQQHIEFARYCAGVFNHLYGSDSGGDERAEGMTELLVGPEAVISPAKRVMSLTEPEKKMSKSHELERSRILLNDSAEDIGKKLKVAMTDSLPGISYDPPKRPGVSNLIEIMSHLEDRSCEDIAAEFKDSSLRTLKERTADVVTRYLAPMREKYETLMHEDGGRALDQIAQNGAEKASASAKPTMDRVRRAVGM